MSDSKKVLLIAPYFIPRRRVGSLRPFKFAIHLSSLGYEPVVLTIGHQPDQLTSKERMMLESIKILSIESPFDRTPGPSKMKKTKKETKKSLAEPVLSWIDKHCPIDTWILLFILRWGWIKRVTKITKPDLIMATGDPWSGLWLGEKLSKKLKIPFVADFRDPWTLGGLELRERSSFSAEMDRIIEKKVIERADRLIFTSLQTSKLYSDKYQIPPIKIATIYNSFEPGLMKKSSDSINSMQLDSSRVNILFLGRFRRLSSTEVMVDLIRQIRTTNPEMIDWIRIHSFGKPDKDEIERIEMAAQSSLFIYHKPFKPEESLQIMNRADLLLLSTSRERSAIIPAKLWDYLFSEVPILSVVPNPEVNTIVKVTDAGIHFNSDNITELSDFLIQTVEAKRSGVELPLPNRKDSNAIQKFTSKAAARKLATVFDEVLQES